MKVYISTACSTQSALPDVLEELAELGFRNIELTGNIKYTNGIYEKLVSFGDTYGLDYIIHNYFPFGPDEFVINLASSNSEVRGKTLQHVKNATDLLRKLGKKLYTVHPGFKNDLVPVLRNDFFISDGSPPCRREDFYSTIDEVLDTILTDGFKLAIENIHPKSRDELYSFLCSPDDIKSFFEYYSDRPGIGLLLDMGHLNVAAARLGFDRYEALDMIFNEHGEKIFAVHVSGNDGDSDAHDITGPDSWQIRYLSDNRSCLGDIPVTMEWQGHCGKEAFEQFAAVKDKLEG